jgi:rubrerythrin
MSGSDESVRRDLIRLLQMAYSGEKAAALAYQGHARSLSDPAQRKRVEEIERDEWVHRKTVGRLLAALGARPAAHREVRAAVVGHTLSVLCAVSGWFLPMFFAGRLETKNVAEYDRAAEYAKALGLETFLPDLTEMAEVEVQHERFFLEVLGRKAPERSGARTR